MIRGRAQRRVSRGYGTEGLVSRGGPGRRSVSAAAGVGDVPVRRVAEGLGTAAAPADGTATVGLGPTGGTGATYGAGGGSESAALVSSLGAAHALMTSAARTKPAYA